MHLLTLLEAAKEGDQRKQPTNRAQTCKPERDGAPQFRAVVDRHGAFIPHEIRDPLTSRVADISIAQPPGRPPEVLAIGPFKIR